MQNHIVKGWLGNLNGTYATVLVTGFSLSVVFAAALSSA